MAEKTVNGSKGHHKFTVKMNEVSGSMSIPNNTTKVSWEVWLAPLDTGWDWNFTYNDPFTLTLNVNGTSYSYTLRYYDGKSNVKIGSGTQTITHNTDGTKSMIWSFSFADNPEYSDRTYLPGSGSSGNQTLTLSVVPRYGTSVQSLSSKTETSIVMNWSSDNTVDYLWYSINDGSSWVAVGSKNAKSGTYTISGLSANTTYKIKTRIRRKDSQLTTNSSTLSIATYAYPYANSMPNIVIGNEATIGVYNPLGRSFTLTVIASNNAEVTTISSYTGTSVKGFKSTEYVNLFYNSIPNAKSATYKVRINYGSHTETRTGGTYSANEFVAKADIGSFTYYDSNPVSTAVTQDTQQIVQTISNVNFDVQDVTTKYGATVSSVSVVLEGNTTILTEVPSGDEWLGSAGAVSSSLDVTATVTVTDSRGIKATKDVAITVLPWKIPSAIITLERHNNYYSETDLKVDADYSYIDGKNAVTIEYSYEENVEGATPSAYVAIEEMRTYVISLDNEKEWMVHVKVTDLLNGTVTYHVPLGKGTTIAFFDRMKESVGINMFPEHDGTLESKGLIYEEGETLSYRYGSLASHWNDYGGFANGTSIANTTWTTAATIELPKGLNLVLCYFSFQSNSTGQRLMLVSSSSSDTSRYIAMGHDYRNAYSGNITNLSCAFICNEPAAKTVYMRVYQNSGSSLTGSARYSVIRLAPYQQ